MTPEDRFKQEWNDPTRIRFAVEGEDVSVAQVAEQFFNKGYYYAKQAAQALATILYTNSINGDVFVPEGLEKYEIYAVAAKALLDLIVSMDQAPEKRSQH